MRVPDNDFLQFTLSHSEGHPPFQQAFTGGVAYFEQVGIVRIEPSEPSEDRVILSSGIHGNETAPMELLNQLLQAILNGTLQPAVNILFIIGHPKAAIAEKRFCDVNLNRLFGGAWRDYDGMEVVRAQQLERLVDDFFSTSHAGIRLHCDLHTAIRDSQHQTFAVHPFTVERPYEARWFSFLAALGLEAILLSHQPATTFSYYSYSQHNAQAATIELGKVRPFGENDLARLAQVTQALKKLITEGELAQTSYEAMKCFAVIDVLIKDAEDFELKVAKDVSNFTAFTEGMILAQSSNSQYNIKQSGDALVFPNTDLPVGQRAGLVVREIVWRNLTLI